MDARLAPLAAILDLNTDLLLNTLAGLTEAESQHRLEGGGNSIAFLAGHLTDTRHFLVTRLGHPLPNPLARYLADVRSIEEVRELPSLEEIRSAWQAVSAHLLAVLAELTPAELAEPKVHRFPLEDSTRLGMVAFLAQH